MPQAVTYAAFLESKRSNMAFAVYIYALVDPLTLETRYIGKSIRPKERLMNHCNEQADSWRNRWLKQLRACGLKPRLRILERIDSREQNWQDVERAWIAYGRSEGWPLTNCTDGGDGVTNLPPEVRARMSRVWIGRKHSRETREKIGAASRGRRHSSESKEHMRRLMTGRMITWNEKLRQAISKLTDEQVVAIKIALRQPDANQTHLAKHYGVHKGTISNIKRGVCYGWVSVNNLQNAERLKTQGTLFSETSV
jgi:hypothetical protein